MSLSFISIRKKHEQKKVNFNRGIYLTPRIVRALKKNINSSFPQIRTRRQLTFYTRRQLLARPGLAERGVDLIEKELEKKGLKLKNSYCSKCGALLNIYDRNRVASQKPIRSVAS